MDTQLIRLDAPYNLICGNESSYYGKFGLHIATLIMVSDRKTKDSLGNMTIETEVNCYPIVKVEGKPEGEVWMGSELKDCMVVGRQNGTIGFHTFKKVMEFFHNHGVSNLRVIPYILVAFLIESGIKYKFPGETNTGVLTKWDYIVNLVFDETNEDTYIVYNDKNSDFFFCTGWVGHDDTNSEGGYTKDDAIRELARLRDSYREALGFSNIKKITFTTNNEKYQSFVDQLNKYNLSTLGICRQ